jgi:predicted site-specific integrase-resolvase
VQEVAERIGASVHTVQRWDREGRLKPARSPGNRRIYSGVLLRQVLQLRAVALATPRRTVVYLRVSSHNQRPDLEYQRKVLEQFCVARGLTAGEWISKEALASDATSAQDPAQSDA